MSYTPKHKPAGSPDGGQFAPSDSRLEEAGEIDLHESVESPEVYYEGLPGCRIYSDVDRAERIKEMQEDLASSVQQVIKDGKLEECLSAMATSKLRNWSFANQFYARMQAAGVRAGLPEDHRYKNAPVVAMSAKAWEREYGAKPVKGTRAIWIQAPIVRQIKEVKDGKEETRTILTGFRPQAEFDISQVEGDNLPEVEFGKNMTIPAGTVPPGVVTGLRNRIESSGYAYSEENIPGADPEQGTGTLGYTHPQTKRVVVDARCSPAQKVSVMAHELAHIKHGHVDGEYSEYINHRGRMETEAEATAHMLMTGLGVGKDAEPSTFSAYYIAGWSRGDNDMVTKSLTASAKKYNEIIDGPWPDKD